MFKNSCCGWKVDEADAKRSQINGYDVVLKTAGFWNVYFLGISLVFADLLVSWHIGLESGFWEYVISTVVVGSAYVCLMLCLAEMTSILPFGGGAYGFARVTAGPFVGFLVGCFESFGNIMYVAVAVVPMGECITFIADGDLRYEPLYWLIIYCSSLTVLIFGGTSFFRFTTVLGVITMLLVVLYLLGTIPNMDFGRFVARQDGYRQEGGLFPDGIRGFVSLLPISSWFYVGIDLMPLVCSDAQKAKHIVPRSIVAAMLTIFIFSFAVLFAASAQSPGVVELYSMEEGVPLDWGYAQLFNIDLRMATILSMPGLFISNYAFMYAYGKQLYAMSRSHLLPSFMSWTYGKIQTPYTSLLLGGLLGYCTMLLVFYFSANVFNGLDNIYNACQMGSFAAYMAMFASFVIFRVKYHNLERNFVNPLGVLSAVYGSTVFFLSFVGVAFLQEDGYVSILIFTLFVAFMTVYYFAYAQHTQCFSPEEQSILFVVYVMKANFRRRLFARFNQSAAKQSNNNNNSNSERSSRHASPDHSGSIHRSRAHSHDTPQQHSLVGINSNNNTELFHTEIEQGGRHDGAAHKMSAEDPNSPTVRYRRVIDNLPDPDLDTQLDSTRVHKPSNETTASRIFSLRRSFLSSTQQHSQSHSQRQQYDQTDTLEGAKDDCCKDDDTDMNGFEAHLLSMPLMQRTLSKGSNLSQKTASDVANEIINYSNNSSSRINSSKIANKSIKKRSNSKSKVSFSLDVVVEKEKSERENSRTIRVVNVSDKSVDQSATIAQREAAMCISNSAAVCGEKSSKVLPFEDMEG